jgi:DNA-directed RNA polymerase subunit RPC12/RpoP
MLDGAEYGNLAFYGEARLSSDDTVRCPSCGGADIRHSLPRGLLDSFMMAFGKTPFRCRRCERRFYRSVAVPAPAGPDGPEKTALVKPEP